jgi:phage shock protein C
MQLVTRIQGFCEKQAFGVCTFWGEKIGVATGSVRLFFIYLSFLTLGSPLVIYLVLFFTMNIHRHFRKKRNPVWDF